MGNYKAVVGTNLENRYKHLNMSNEINSKKILNGVRLLHLLKSRLNFSVFSNKLLLSKCKIET